MSAGAVRSPAMALGFGEGLAGSSSFGFEAASLPAARTEATSEAIEAFCSSLPKTATKQPKGLST
eukprot:9160562-Lingulodinium_polyedra.AAC.1